MSNRARTGATMLTEDQLDWLCNGWCMDIDTPDRLPFTDMEAARRAWIGHRFDVIAQSRAEGQLIPVAWWKFENPSQEGKTQLSGPAPLQPVELYRGAPKMWRSYEDCCAAIFESDEAYLSRLGYIRQTLRRKS